MQTAHDAHAGPKPVIFEAAEHPLPALGNVLVTFAVLMVLAAVALAVGFSDLGLATGRGAAAGSAGARTRDSADQSHDTPDVTDR